ncbi:B-cell linker protein-like protein [Dinothrombium tinctorium]|uniref:B-cell linker protein-like protein n=1 Tax=Dinothrombium tinctorium TaxID=1965070 RepID=A0A443RPC9_9ACAR|nr:B-cell linker protein-like protein [Dinothrombium tinctorium]
MAAVYDDDDNASWGSEFDDDLDDDESDEDSSRCGSYSFNDHDSHLRQHQLNGIMATSFENTYESVYETPSSSSCGEGSENSSSSFETMSEFSDPNGNKSQVITYSNHTQIVNGERTPTAHETRDSKETDCDLINNNNDKNCLPLTTKSTRPESDENSSEKASQQAISRPLQKPVIPPKPNLRVQAVMNNVTARPKTKKIVRPPTEPPPPPLPKSPPPVSTGRPLYIPSQPELTLAELNRVLDEEQNDYEPPICVANNQEQNKELITRSCSSSSQNRSSDSDSGSGSLPLRVTPPPGFNDNTYEPMTAGMAGSTPNLSYSEGNYEEVPDEELLTPRERFLGSTISLTTIAELNRPKLPRVKLNNNSASSTLKFPERLKLLPEKLMRSDKSLTGNEFSEFRRETRSASVGSLNPAHRPLPPVPPLPPLPYGAIIEECELLHNYEWFHDIEREEAAELLQKLGAEGGYIVRESKRAGKCNPFSLTIFHDNKIFHLNIRRREDGFYALGKRKEREKTFKTVQDLIKYHQNEPILLTTKGQAAGMTKLVITPPH